VVSMRSNLFPAAIRLLVVSACVFGLWESWKFERSETLFGQATPESIGAAIRVEPDCWWCYVRLARFDENHAEALLQTSLQLNPYDSEAAIDLSSRYEADGDFRRAEQLLLQAFAVDRTYAPRFSLANFYFRRNNLPAFWTWARRAAEMPADNMGALFELCSHVALDARTIESNIVGNDPVVIRQFVDFLIAKRQSKAAVHAATNLIHFGSEEKDHERIYGLVDELAAANDSADANALWRQLMREHWIPADESIPYNHAFAHDSLPVHFDWTYFMFTGLHSWPGPSGLMIEFTGDEPENCPIAEETISLSPGKYRLDSSYSTESIPANSGIRWQITEPRSQTVVARSTSLSGHSPGSVSVLFSVNPGQELLLLQLVYQRELGTERVRGTLVIPSVTIQAFR
jgi:tetratricopeptide (TPR) repeat protein